MAAVALRPDADRAAVIAEVNALIATPPPVALHNGVSLTMVAGSVTAAGVAVTQAGDFSAAKNSTGNYTVTFSPVYAAAPAVSASIDAAAAMIRVTRAAGTLTVLTYNTAGVAADAAFSFVAVGAA